MRYELNEYGKRKIEIFRKNLLAKRKEILDAGIIDTAFDTPVPDESDIVSDALAEGFDDDGDSVNCWMCTDNYDSEPICLNIDEDFNLINDAV